MHQFRNIEAWKRSRAIAIRIYRLTRSFPRDERFGLVSQVRRAALSIGANIVEGSKRSDRGFALFLSIAEGSAGETWYLLDLAPDLDACTTEAVKPVCDELLEIEKMLHALRRTVLRNAKPKKKQNLESRF
jgi:four helix bundle protein